MTSILDRMKRETSRAAFEADRVLRIRRIEGRIGEIRRQITQHAYQIGTKAIELSKGEEWASPPGLVPLLDSVRGLLVGG